MLHVDNRPENARQVPVNVPHPRRDGQDVAGRGDQPTQPRPNGAVTPRDVGVLTAFSLVWAAYLWFHVAGAIHLFGRP